MTHNCYETTACGCIKCLYLIIIIIIINQFRKKGWAYRCFMYGKHTLYLSRSLFLTDAHIVCTHTLTCMLMMLALLWRFYQLHQLKNDMTSHTRDNNGAVHEGNLSLSLITWLITALVCYQRLKIHKYFHPQLFVNLLHNRHGFTLIITKHRILTHFCMYLSVYALKYDVTCPCSVVSERIHSNRPEEVQVLFHA